MAHSGTVIHMRNVPANGDGWRALDRSLPYRRMDGSWGLIPPDFCWDGNSSGLLSPLFPKWNHPIASCRHDWRCKTAKTPEERLFADKEFEKDVGTTSWWLTKKIGYLGVRAGALLGIGVNY